MLSTTTIKKHYKLIEFIVFVLFFTALYLYAHTKWYAIVALAGYFLGNTFFLGKLLKADDVKDKKFPAG